MHFIHVYILLYKDVCIAEVLIDSQVIESVHARKSFLSERQMGLMHFGSSKTL